MGRVSYTTHPVQPYRVRSSTQRNEMGRQGGQGVQVPAGLAGGQAPAGRKLGYGGPGLVEGPCAPGRERYS